VISLAATGTAPSHRRQPPPRQSRSGDQAGDNPHGRSDRRRPYSEEIRRRADRHWQLRELTGLLLAAAAGDDEELAECVAKLKTGPILG
jgi:hypothetical protein